MPKLVYEVLPELRETAEQGVARRFQFGEDGTVLSSCKGAAPVSLTKGSTTVSVLPSADGDGGAKLVAALDGGVAVCAYRADNPEPLPPPPPPASEVAAEGESAAEGGEGDTLPPLPEHSVPVPAKEPILSIKVTTAKGASVELSTDGITHVIPPSALLARNGGLSSGKAIGVATHGAPVSPGESLLAPPAVSRRSVLPDGSLVTAYADGSVTILHSDGTTSERLASVDGYIYADGSDAKGWVRTLLDGTRFREPDEGCEPRPPPPPPPPPPEPEPEDPKKAKGGKGAKKEEEAPPLLRLPLPLLRLPRLVSCNCRRFHLLR